MSATVELVAFPDAEAVLVAYLNRELVAHGDSAHVSTRHPSDVAIPARAATGSCV